ncbi:NAD-dependent epimerase/dehydratase family protein [Aeromicrobium sp. SMF47]|uniref:NAD-dependent epimerase/dehydratase family protein n=1 Tax=Aeromicrobium yanjiei TaxID=2662028 RepID=A0A5Q2MHY7_9ACTN|nr:MULTISPECIES: NAD-dependent epimerase/dehydratase family protein [Aeromicrobium]MRJ76038.1 NAD-dependent epimerase/dehydratase family protein [Aeromicrobium yanjiei]MRK00388.1 NAD-dependent epimerase/dehydratase family protein [Aeromicrobium sp. S22]QGG42737.1 NAD-dependent epimerase/dehydratase family protein [Aeromicrobium yanjiei]
MSRVVLVTGVAGSFASKFARRLADIGEGAGIERVVGIDTILPDADLGSVKFVRADIRTPVVGKVIAVDDVDTVVHLDVNPPQRGRGAGAKELNVIGTMQLLAACQRSALVSKLVLGSSTAVYGSSPRDPAMFTESLLARNGVRTGFPKDIVEVESYVRGFARRRPEVLITTIRAAQVLHPEIDSPLRNYFSNPVLPSVLGFDPRLQFLSLEDALEILVQAVVRDRPGTFNAAGDGVVLLSQAARRLGRPVIPLPPVGFAMAARRVVRAMGSDIPPDLHRLLTFGRAVDTTGLRDIFGYELARTSEETFDEFRASLKPGLLAALGGRS